VNPFRRRPQSEAATIKARYRKQLVDGTVTPRTAVDAPVDVPSIDVLARLALQAQRPMAYVPAKLPGKDEFHVDDFGVRYRYLADA
jgi:hypothetical protein